MYLEMSYEHYLVLNKMFRSDPVCETTVQAAVVQTKGLWAYYSICSPCRRLDLQYVWVLAKYVTPDFEGAWPE